MSAAPDIATSNPADDAIGKMLPLVTPLGVETVDWRLAAGRILAEPIVTDRPSPPSDVSAMDGYAMRLADVATPRLAVASSVLPGRPAPSLPPDSCVRIMTGAVVPPEADLVIRREDVTENETHIAVNPAVIPTLKHGLSIRRRGENAPAGAQAISAGTLITSPILSAIVSFGVAKVAVHRRVRVALLITGDELLPPESPAEPWQIRDSNGPALIALLGRCPWIEIVSHQRIADDEAQLLHAVKKAIASSDAILLTGGVSMGTHDFVPAVLREAGCSIVFHKLPIRPGNPVLGAVGPAGQPIFGLPGNPQSVMVTARRIAMPLLARRSGLSEITPPAAVTLREHDGKSIKLAWSRPVKITAPGEATLVDTKGSGDIISAARSDGFVEIPPEQNGTGPWPFYAWSF